MTVILMIMLLLLQWIMIMLIIAFLSSLFLMMWHFIILAVSTLWAVSAVNDSDSDSEDLLHTLDLSVLSQFYTFNAFSYLKTSVSTFTHSLHLQSVHSVNSLLIMPLKCSCTASSTVALKVCISVTHFCVHCLKDLMSHYSYHSEQCKYSVWDQKCFYCSQQHHVCISVSVYNLCILYLLMLTFLYEFLHSLSRLSTILSLSSLMLLLCMRLLMSLILICMCIFCFNRYFCFIFYFCFCNVLHSFHKMLTCVCI